MPTQYARPSRSNSRRNSVTVPNALSAGTTPRSPLASARRSTARAVRHFGRSATDSGTPGRGSALRVGGPGLGQVRLGVEGHDLRRRGERERHRDPAARHLAERPGVLPGHADGVRALLGEPGVVDDEVALAAEPAGDPGVQGVEEFPLVPGALVEELLQRLPVVLVARFDGPEARGHGLDALAVAVEQEAAEVGVAPPPPAGVAQGPGHVVRERRQILPQLGQRSCVHPPILTEIGRPSRSLNGVILDGGHEAGLHAPRRLRPPLGIDVGFDRGCDHSPNDSPAVS